MTDTPEQRARREIDANLQAAGWLVRDRGEMDLTSGPGIAVREFPMKSGFGSADYVLYVGFDVVGAIEAKAEGTLSGVEAQTAKYAAGLPDDLPAPRRPLPFLFESNGAVTYLTNGLDPAPRGRQVPLRRHQQHHRLRRWDDRMGAGYGVYGESSVGPNGGLGNFR